MAIGWQLFGNGSGVLNGRATVTCLAQQPSGLNIYLASDRLISEPVLDSTQGQVLNNRYKVGGSGSWERPWGPYLP